ncbi:MAG: acyl carrier protein [Rhodospirillaceae bacterium]|nr:acyl carrier protein [Rhodospirillaceae bacterium]MBT6831067.1 acyl carrier protein [Rhodospirillaceae bacterium]MBT7291394.1 acyl carrier protein [Rhodospirillaceae bacterium]
MKSRDEIFDFLKKLLVDHFEMQEDSITLDARLYEDLDLDSIDAVDMIVELKRVTGKNMDPNAFKQVRTVEDVVAAVYDLVNG